MTARFTFADAREIISPRVVPLVPWASESPPWLDCGDITAPDFGTLWAEPGHAGSTILWATRDRKHFAETIYAPRQVGSEHVWQGRRWKVRRLPGAGPEAA